MYDREKEEGGLCTMDKVSVERLGDAMVRSWVRAAEQTCCGSCNL